MQLTFSYWSQDVGFLLISVGSAADHEQYDQWDITSNHLNERAVIQLLTVILQLYSVILFSYSVIDPNYVTLSIFITNYRQCM